MKLWGRVRCLVFFDSQCSCSLDNNLRCCVFVVVVLKCKIGLFSCVTNACGCCYTIEDLIEIQAVALLNNSEEWTDDVYSLSASVMDGVSITYFMFTK